MRRLKNLVLVVILAVSMIFQSTAGMETHTVMAEETVGHLIINQVYGGNNKGETPLANSFIELYNPTSEDVDLTEYSIVYDSHTINLSEGAVMKPQSSWLIVCAPEETSDEYQTYDFPTSDQNWEVAINNKDYTIDLKNGTEIVDTIVADSNVAELKISKQKSLRRKNYTDTDSNSDWEVVVWEKSSVTVDDAYVQKYAPRNSKGEFGKVHQASDTPVYVPVTASDEKVTGVNNGKGTLDVELFARHNSGASNADGGSLEIVEYNSANGFTYAVSGLKGKVIATKISDVKSQDKVVNLQGTEYDVKELVEQKTGVEDFVYGDTTSVAVSPDGTKLAAAIQHADYDKAGVVAVFTCNEDGTLTEPKLYSTGVQPDMVTFADDNIVLTADEGEPRMGYAEGTTDPKGTVSIIDIQKNSSTQVGFENFSAEELIAENIIVGVVDGKNIAPETDLEPEYIAVSSDGSKAYISLQEANAIGVLDITAEKITGIYSAGYQDYSKVSVDIVEDSLYKAQTYDNLVGARMPDGITIYEKDGKTYILTANEGDAREWGDYLNEAKTKDFTGENIRILDSTKCAGLPEGKSVMFGGRGFSVFEVTESGLREVYDSGNDFEKITAKVLPNYFNSSNDDIDIDSRSAKKGPEPENVTVGTVNGKTYAFIALERIGGIMIYDITEAEKTIYANYINSREFDSEIQGDVSPEGLCFVSSNEAGKALIIAACEVSGTLPVYELSSKNSTDDKEEEKPTAHKHTPTVTKAVASTYFTTGYTGDTYCKECGILISKGRSIPKKKLKKPVIKVKSGKKKVTVTYKKVKSATFYQVKIKAGKKWKTYKAKSGKIVIRKLKKGKIYRVKVRAVVRAGKKQAYSKYSKIKKVRVK